MRKKIICLIEEVIDRKMECFKRNAVFLLKQMNLNAKTNTFRSLILKQNTLFTSGSMLAAFKLLGYFNGLCGFRMVATRFPSDGTPLLNSTSGRISEHTDDFRLLFNGAKKYFGAFSAALSSFSGDSSCTTSPSSVKVGGGGNGKDVLLLQ